MYDMLHSYVHELMREFIENRNSMSATERDIKYGQIQGVLESITLCIQYELTQKNKEELSNE